MIYFDNAATTKIKEEVIESMLPFMRDEYGNPDGKYYSLAKNAKAAISNSRKSVSAFFNCKDNEVFFTSGATESNNTIIKSIFELNVLNNPHFITSKIEHASILEVYRYLETKGADVTYLDVDSKGLISLEKLDNAINENTVLVSLAYVNGEIGTIQNIDKISEICFKSNVLLHIDATQAINQLVIDLEDLIGVSFVSFSGHKVYGPKGIGGFIMKKDKDGIRLKFISLLHGGNQESYLRAGTSPVFLIVGMGKAFEIISRDRQLILNQLNMLDNLFIQKINKVSENICYIVNDFPNRIKGIINIRFVNQNNQILLLKASEYFAASTGSACSNTKPSYVLSEIGLGEKEIKECIRFSLGTFNTIDDIEKFMEILF